MGRKKFADNYADEENLVGRPLTPEVLARLSSECREALAMAFQVDGGDDDDMDEDTDDDEPEAMDEGEDEKKEAAKVGKFFHKFSEDFPKRTTMGSLIEGFLCARRHNPGLRASEFLGRRL
jgi:hypothetical protein